MGRFGEFSRRQSSLDVIMDVDNGLGRIVSGLLEELAPCTRNASLRKGCHRGSSTDDCYHTPSYWMGITEINGSVRNTGLGLAESCSLGGGVG